MATTSLKGAQRRRRSRRDCANGASIEIEGDQLYDVTTMFALRLFALGVPLLAAMCGCLGACASARGSGVPPPKVDATAEARSAPEGGAKARVPGAPYAWPARRGWKADTRRFPLPYAPEVTYRGIEDVRFAPGFFDPKAETYWSYVFAFILEDPAELTPAELSRDLTSFFAGLAKSVDPGRFDGAAHRALVHAAGAQGYRGTIDTVDAFGDGRALRLHLEGERFRCGGQLVAIASLSPQPRESARVWAALEDQRQAFSCTAP